MSKAKVFFISARSKIVGTTPPYGSSLIEKTQKVFRAANLAGCISSGDKVAIKCHPGGDLNTGYLRPSLVRTVVDEVTAAGGEPFVTDATTVLGWGMHGDRFTALDLLKTAARNGYTQETLGCPFIVADGWCGTDHIPIDVEGSEIKTAYVSSAIVGADSMIVTTHFKTGPAFGGALKNVAVGCLSRLGKENLHAQGGKIYIDKSKCPGHECTWADVCQRICPENAIKVLKDSAEIDVEKCRFCAFCWRMCGFSGHNAIRHRDGFESLMIRCTETASAIMKPFRKGKVGYITFFIDVNPVCDCLPFMDVRMFQDVGILASTDLVAIEKATLDLLEKASGLPSSKAEDMGIVKPSPDRIRKLYGFDPRDKVLAAAEKMGLGTQEYELIEIPQEIEKPPIERIEKVKSYRQKLSTLGFQLRH